MEKIIDFHDIYDFYYTPWYQTTWFYVLVGITGLALIAGIIVYIVRRRKQAVPPWQWAWQELKKLSLDNCRTPEDYKKFYFHLTSIVKTYLHKRFDWQTEDKTDEELITWLEKKHFDQHLITMLSKLSQDAVWIKYANVAALKSQAEAEADIKTVQTLIERTTPNDKSR